MISEHDLQALSLADLALLLHLVYTEFYRRLAGSGNHPVVERIESEEELDPGVPFPHGDDYDQEEIDTWPDFEPWHPSWVGLSPAAISYQAEQQMLETMDQKVLYRIRHNRALRVRCRIQFHLDHLLDELHIKGGDDAMQPKRENPSSDDEFW